MTDESPGPSEEGLPRCSVMQEVQRTLVPRSHSSLCSFLAESCEGKINVPHVPNEPHATLRGVKENRGRIHSSEARKKKVHALEHGMPIILVLTLKMN